MGYCNTVFYLFLGLIKYFLSLKVLIYSGPHGWTCVSVWNGAFRRSSSSFPLVPTQRDLYLAPGTFVKVPCFTLYLLFMLYWFENKLLNAKDLVIHPDISDLKPLASNLKHQKILLSLIPFLNLTHKLNQALKSFI